MGDDIGAGVPAIIEAARAQRGAEVIDVAHGIDLTQLPGGVQIDSVPMLLMPTAHGQEPLSVLEEIEAYRKAFATEPFRRKGTATLEELDSFVAHAVRFKDAGSAIFVSGGATAPKFTSVIDYHPAGEAEKTAPRFGEHRGTYTPAFSPEWLAWKAVDGKGLTQAGFASLITTNVRDVFDVPEGDGPPLTEAPQWYADRFGKGRTPADFFASAERLLGLAEGLSVTVEDRVTDVARRDTGEQRITFTSTAATEVEVPVAFVIQLPIFVGGDLYQIPVRLRFFLRTEGDMKRASWRIELFGADRTVLACVEAMREKIAAGTGLPLFAGSPE